MKKALLTEQQLIEKINDAFAEAMPESGHRWEVQSLTRVYKPSANWEADFHVSGPELATIDQHRPTYEHVLEDLAGSYDVDWSAQVDEA